MTLKQVTRMKDLVAAICFIVAGWAALKLRAAAAAPGASKQ
jgi:hypothetical protein